MTVFRGRRVTRVENGLGNRKTVVCRFLGLMRREYGSQCFVAPSRSLFGDNAFTRRDQIGQLRQFDGMPRGPAICNGKTVNIVVVEWDA